MKEHLSLNQQIVKIVVFGMLWLMIGCVLGAFYGKLNGVQNLVFFIYHSAFWLPAVMILIWYALKNDLDILAFVICFALGSPVLIEAVARMWQDNGIADFATVAHKYRFLSIPAVLLAALFVWLIVDYFRARKNRDAEIRFKFSGTRAVRLCGTRTPWLRKI